MTEIALLSDLHLEFGSEPHIKLPDADILILAGDVIEARFLEERMNDSAARGYRKSFHRLMKRIQEKGYELVIAIAGNHEFYYASTIQEAHDILREVYAQYGFSYLNNECLHYKDHIFIGSTLWSNFHNEDPHSMHAAEQYMNDFRAIPDWSAETCLKHHKLAVATIEAFIDMSELTPIVITHHAPSFKSMDPKYASPSHHLVNGAYMSDLEDLVKRAKVWCHGHLHYKNFYQIGDATVMCNPVGYYPYEGVIADTRMTVTV